MKTLSQRINENFNITEASGDVTVKYNTEISGSINLLGSGWSYFTRENGYSSKEEMANDYITDLLLLNGEITVQRNFFEIKGTLANGMTINASQKGEFDMYGGSYEPKMSKAKIIINDKDVTSIAEKFSTKYHGDVNISFDLMRTDMWARDTLKQLGVNRQLIKKL